MKVTGDDGGRESCMSLRKFLQKKQTLHTQSRSQDVWRALKLVTGEPYVFVIWLWKLMLNPWDLSHKCLLAVVCLQNCTSRENAFNKRKECAKNENFGLTVTNVVRKMVQCIRLNFIFITTSIDQYLDMFKLKHHADTSQIRIRPCFF